MGKATTLSANHSFYEGFAQIMDFGGLLSDYNDYLLSAQDLDLLALRSDWQAVWDDLAFAIRSFEATHPDLAKRVQAKKTIKSK